MSFLLLFCQPGFEDQLAFFKIDRNSGIIPDLASQDFPREIGLDLALQEPFQGPGAKHRVVSFARDMLLGRIAQFQFNVTVSETPAKKRELEFHDLFDLSQGQSLEKHDLVDSI